jgi:hypothetical protein
MVAMAALRGTKIRYTCLLVHLVGDDLADGVEEGRELSSHCSYEVVDLFKSTCVISLVLENLDQLKGSMVITSTPGRWSLATHAGRLPVYHQ